MYIYFSSSPSVPVASAHLKLLALSQASPATVPTGPVVGFPLVSQVRKLIKAAISKIKKIKVIFRISSVSIAPGGDLLFQMLFWSSTNHFAQSTSLQLTPAVFCLLKTGKINNLNL